MAAAHIDHESNNMFQESLQQSSTMSLHDALAQAKETAMRLDREMENSDRYRAAFLKTSDHKANEIVDIKVRGQRRTGQENEPRNGAAAIMIQHSPPRSKRVASKAGKDKKKAQTQNIRKQYQDYYRQMGSTERPSDKPAYLKGVQSKIRDQVRETRNYMQQANPSNEPFVEIFVAPKPEKKKKPQKPAPSARTSEQPASSRNHGSARLKREIQEPTIIREKPSKHRDQVQELLDSPFVGQFASEQNHQLIEQSMVSERSSLYDQHQVETVSQI